jgi:protein TIF31
VREAVNIYEQVYGPVHSETGKAYAKLAMLCFNRKEIQPAVNLQRHAVVVAERSLGLDNAETVQQYLNLGYFEYRNGSKNAGLFLIDYALKQWNLLSQGIHPESTQIYVSFYEYSCLEQYRVYYARATIISNRH